MGNGYFPSIWQQINVNSYYCIEFKLPKCVVGEMNISITVIYGKPEEYLYEGNVWAKIDNDLIQGFIMPISVRGDKDTDEITSIVSAINCDENFIPTVESYIETMRPCGQF